MFTINQRYNDLFDLKPDNYIDKNYPLEKLKGNLSKITTTSFSEIYLCNHKIYKFSSNKYRLGELKREYNIQKSLNNMNIDYVPKVYGFEIENDRGYIIEEYIKGKTLKELLKEVNDNEKCKLWEKVGETLKHIHNIPVINKDNNWIDKQLQIAKQNLDLNVLDESEFYNNSPNKVYDWLLDNKPTSNETTLLHGDFRTKNIIITPDNDLKIIDWGFVDIGDPYYDLAIIDYYFKDDNNRKSFYKGYGSSYNKDKIEYFDKLSKFINL